MNRFDLLNTPLAGRNLIEASAGTGKTFTIAGVYLRLVLEERLAVPEILVVTFTEAATKELKERIRKRLKEAEEAFECGSSEDALLSGLLLKIDDHPAASRRLSTAVRSFDEAAIFTIHGFCQRTLQENPFESGSLCDTELMTDQGTILREIAQDYWRINCYGQSRERVAAANAAGISPGSLAGMVRKVAADPFAAVIPDAPSDIAETEQWLLALRRGFFDYLAAELPKRKRTRNVRSFDDLLLDLHSALSRKGSALPRLVRERYKAALIDEFQDTDPTQFAIFDAIYPTGHPSPFFLIGDPKQAIYSFRGADIFAYMGAAKATKEKHTLLENWRSEPPLINAVNTIFASNKLPFLFDAIKFTPVLAAQKDGVVLTESGKSTAPLKLWVAPRKESGKPINKTDAWETLPEAVASEISRLLDSSRSKVKIGDRAVEPGDIAVLVRANRQAKLMQRALTRRGIPSVLCSAGNLFESDEAAELLRILSAVAEPGNEALLRGALATDLVGVSGDELARLMGDEAGWEQVLEEFRSYNETWMNRGCMAMALQFMERRQVRERLLSAPMGERRLTNLLHAVETIHQAQIQGHLGMEGVIAWLACRIIEEPKREEHEIRLETDEAAVQLVTIHKSKGLEYPVVFLPFCWSEYGGKEESALYHDQKTGKVVLDIGSTQLAEHKAKAKEESLAESLRLLYVAVTRGKHRTYLVWGAFKDAGDCGLHYLLHPDARSARGQVALSDQEILDDLHKLAAASAGSMEVQEIPPAGRERYRAEANDASALACRTFEGSIGNDWRVASFTSLAKRQHHEAELPDRDEGTRAEPEKTEVPAEGIFAFPRGAKAGTFLHKVFEDLDFDASPETRKELVTRLLNDHGFDGEWRDAVCGMVQSVLCAPLGETGFSLAGIGAERRLTELEFFFPLAAVTSERLRNAVARYSKQPFPVDLPGMFSRLSFSPVQGMLRGFMDLVVEHGGRFYILDWKSNHLGNRVEDYDEPGMRREMEHSLYPLQYLLYTVALDNYLKLRIPEYDYHRHFGGVFYIFLRGVDGKGNGVFADRPPKALIEELSEVLVNRVKPAAPASPREEARKWVQQDLWGATTSPSPRLSPGTRGKR